MKSIIVQLYIVHVQSNKMASKERERGLQIYCCLLVWCEQLLAVLDEYCCCASLWCEYS